jgi:L-fuculose-phosphate aldolase
MQSFSTRSVRSRLAQAARELGLRGLTAGAGGNVSAREGDLCWIKPSGTSLRDLKAYELCGVRLSDGHRVRGRGCPSSELLLHLALYRARPDVHAIFHTHSSAATGIATSSADFGPLLIESIGYLNGLAAVPYQLRSTRDLAEAAAALARDNDTLLLAHHGVVLLAPGIEEALHRCEVVEEVARALIAAHTVGVPRFLTAAQIAELKELQSVGRPDEGA